MSVLVRPRVLATGLCVVLALAACGTDDGGLPAADDRRPVPAPTPDAEAPTTAVASYDGDVVEIELRYTGAAVDGRGVCWVIERWDADAGDWTEPHHVTVQTSDGGEAVEPTPLSDEFACITLALTGPGPDVVRIPADAVEPGAHRLCEGFEPGGPTCADVEVAEQDEAEHDEPTDAQARAEVLAEAARHRVAVANSFGGDDVFDVVEVVDVLGRAIREGRVEMDAPVPMTVAERDAIATALAPREVTFVDLDDVFLPPNTTMTTDVARIVLAEPVAFDAEAGRAEMTSTLLCGELCAIGSAHLVERDDDGTWVVTDTIDHGWIS